MAKFLGIDMTQDWNDFPIWEEFFDQNPIRSFIELGTGNGGMTTFLALQCMQRGIEFHTFDHQRWFDFSNGIPKLLDLEGHYHFFDLFSEAGTQAVTELIRVSPKPLAVFFDDGNKPREWKTFAHLTSEGDFCIVHDWNVEFFTRDLLDVPVERILAKMCDLRQLGMKSMWFKRTKV